MPELSGLFTAIVTPFNAAGEVAWSGVRPILRFQQDAGIDGVVVCGTNGEGASLTAAERMRMLDTVLEQAHGLLVIAATGAASLPETLELSRHAADAGATALLVLPPFFFKNPPADGLRRYFAKVLESSSVPVLLYNIPQQTAVAIDDALLQSLNIYPSLAGVKDSSGDWATTSHFLEQYPNLSIFPGSDRLLTRSTVTGKAAGSISGGANAFPDLLVAARRAALAGGAGEAQARVDRYLDIVARYPLIAGNKSIMARRGLPRMSVRPPLIDLSASQEQSLLRELESAGLS